jgi:hypothetical protein
MYSIVHTHANTVAHCDANSCPVPSAHPSSNDGPVTRTVCQSDNQSYSISKYSTNSHTDRIADGCTDQCTYVCAHCDTNSESFSSSHGESITSTNHYTDKCTICTTYFCTDSDANSATQSCTYS